jgi:hypothetical protein
MKTRFATPSSLFFPEKPAPSPSLFSACVPHLRALYLAIPWPASDKPDDARGHLFPEAPHLCDATARAMRAHPDLFDTDLCARLRDHLGRASAFYFLHTALSNLTERARLQYQREQRSATLLALGVLGKARANTRSSHPSSRDRLREAALSMPEALYRRWRRRLSHR